MTLDFKFFVSAWAAMSGVMFVICMSGLLSSKVNKWTTWLRALIFSLFIPVVWVIDQFGTLYNAYFLDN